MNNFGTSDMVSPLRRVLVKKPAAAMATADPTTWHYSGSLSADLLQRDHVGFKPRRRVGRTPGGGAAVV